MAAPSEFTKAFAGALSGALGGFVSALVLFPLDVRKTRMQSGSSEGIVSIVKSIVKKDGVLGLWGKTSIILGFQSMVEKFGYFFAYTLIRSLYVRFVGSAPGALTTLAIGYCSEWCQLPFTIPIDKVTVIMRNRMGTDEPQGLLTIAGEVWRKGNLHAGIGGYTLLALKPATQFAAYEPVKAMWLARSGPGSELSAVASFLLGAYSRAVSDSVTYPGRRAKVQKQALVKAKDADERAMAEASVPSLLAYIVRKQGIAGLYKGLSMELFRGVLSGAVSMMVREQADIIATRLILGGITA